MARPIKETPVLTGKSAEQFDREIEENERNKVSRGDYDRAMEAFSKVTVETPEPVEA